MYENIIALCESGYGFKPSITMRNTLKLNEIPVIDKSKFNFNEQKVMVISNNDKSKYFVEFTNNLERFIKDNNISVNEAIERVAEANNIFKNDIVVVLDESCIHKIDVEALSNSYKTVRVK